MHEIKDINVSVALAGDFAGSHLTGDNSKVVPTDTQKNTVFAFAKEAPSARSRSSRCGWRAISSHDFRRRAARARDDRGASVVADRVDGKPHPHAFVRAGSEKRLATVTCTDDERVGRSRAWPTWSLLKSTGSEF